MPKSKMYILHVVLLVVSCVISHAAEYNEQQQRAPIHLDNSAIRNNYHTPAVAAGTNICVEVEAGATAYITQHYVH